jgi:two-component system sensor histidine kinase TctE
MTDSPMSTPSNANGNRSLRRLLLGWLLPFLLVLLVLGAVAAYLVALRTASAAYDRALLDGGLAIAKQVRILGGHAELDLPPVAQQILLTDKYDRIYYLVRGPQGEFVAGHKGLPPPPESPPPERNWVYYDGFYQNEPVRAAALFIPSVYGDIQVTVAETLVKRRNLIREILLGMLVPEILLAAAAIGLIWFGIGRGLAPLARLKGEIAARSSRDLRPVPEDHAPLEIRPVVHGLNELLARLEESLSTQRRFVSNAAHQIRTPVAALQAQVDLALRQQDPDEVRQTLKQISCAAERTSHLTNQLLTLARAEPGGHFATAMTPVDLGEIVQEVAASWMPQALAKDIDLGFEISSARVTGRPLLLRELLANLLDNAIRYTPTGGRITVRTAASDGTALLQVEDNGPGIPEDEREKVLERFYRPEGAPGTGCGLGLAIVNEIALAHDATVKLETPPSGSGLLVNVRFRRPAGGKDGTLPPADRK